MKNTEQSFAAGHDLSGTVDSSGNATHSTGMAFGNSVAIPDKERKANEDAKKTLDDHTQDTMDELMGRSKIDHGIEINPSVGKKRPCRQGCEQYCDTEPPK